MKRMRHAAVALILTACSAVLAVPALSAAGAVAAQVVDRRAVLPKGSRPKISYSRYYVLGYIRDDGDVPFTLTSSFHLRRPRKVWMGIFDAEGQGGFHQVASAKEMPQVFHGGCRVVNLIADADTGETIESWCNSTDALLVNGMPEPLRHYSRHGSPFH
jgi:hypothetical protein